MTAARLRISTSALRILAAVVTVAFVSLLVFVPNSVNDLWLQIKIGEYILDSHSVPGTLMYPFTWAKDQVFHAHEWLASIVLYGFDQAVGNSGLLFVQGGLGLLQFGLCVGLARRLSGSLGFALALASGAMLMANYRYQLRPEIFALLCLTALLHLLTRFQADGRKPGMAWCVPLAIAWANSHGSFLLGPVVAAIFAAGESLEGLRRADAGTPLATRLQAAARRGAPYAVVAGAMLLVSLLNPMGWALLQFAFKLQASPVIKQYVYEWTPTLAPTFTAHQAFWIFAAGWSGVVLAMAAARRRLTATDVLLVAAFTVLALQRNRFVVFFGFVALPVCARLYADRAARARWERGWLLACIVLGGAGTGLTAGFGNVAGLRPHSNNLFTKFSDPFISFLSQPQLKGNVFNSYELGSELAYRAYPRLKPFIDSRVDSYGDNYFVLLYRLLNDEKLLGELVSDFDVRYMLLTRRDFDSVRNFDALRRQWRVAYSDTQLVFLVRAP